MHRDMVIMEGFQEEVAFELDLQEWGGFGHWRWWEAGTLGNGPMRKGGVDIRILLL